MPITISSTPQTLEIPVAGPGDANRLYIFTGEAVVNMKGSGANWRQETLRIEINRTFTATAYKKGIGVASLSGISNKNEAINAGWKIESVEVVRDGDSNKPVLVASIAVRDVDGYLESVSYEVFVLAKIKTAQL